MQIEVYRLSFDRNGAIITLEAICDSFSSFLWDIRYYECGQFEIYIAATVSNVTLFQTGKIIGRSDDHTHYGIIEKIVLETDAENGDYLTVSGRFLMSLLSRRIIYPTLSFTTPTSYGAILRKAVRDNCIPPGGIENGRCIPGLRTSGNWSACWEQTAQLQISYENLMEWVYNICEVTGGTANILLKETVSGSGLYEMIFELSQGMDRSIQQAEQPHVIFSDAYNNLLAFHYEKDISNLQNVAYVLGEGEGSARKRRVCGFQNFLHGWLNRYEVYVDAKDLQQETQNEDGETILLSDQEYQELLLERGNEQFVPATETSESTIAVNSKQYQYQQDYFVGDYVTVKHSRFGLQQERIQLVGMIESFDQNGRSLTPTFQSKIHTE